MLERAHVFQRLKIRTQDIRIVTLWNSLQLGSVNIEIYLEFVVKCGKEKVKRGEPEHIKATLKCLTRLASNCHSVKAGSLEFESIEHYSNCLSCLQTKGTALTALTALSAVSAADPIS